MRSKNFFGLHFAENWQVATLAISTLMTKPDNFSIRLTNDFTATKLSSLKYFGTSTANTIKEDVLGAEIETTWLNDGIRAGYDGIRQQDKTLIRIG